LAHAAPCRWKEGGFAVSAYLNTCEHSGYVVAAFRGEPDPCGPGFAGALCAAARPDAGRVPLRGWLRWRYR
jgi:hypothetical protein